MVKQLQEEGRSICFVGDGINDSIALKTADVAVSLRGASTIATDAAQIVLMDGRLNKLERLFEIGHEFDANLRRGLYATLVPNVIAAGGLLFLNFGILAPLFFYYLGMGLGVANAMWPMAQRDQLTG